MNLLQKTERLLKQNWKERKRITLAVIVSFLINGGVGYATEEDVTLNQSSSVDIKPKNTSSIAVTKDTTTGGTVVDIAKPNDGISHNIYDTFNMNGKDSRVLFNNSGKDESMGESALGFKNVHKNKNFDSETKSATLIISEITGETSAKLEGNLEVRNDNMNQNTDLIFANENGISVNGIKYFGVGSVMYVNDRDWATKEELEKRRRELELEKEKSNNKDIVKPFGHSKKSAGAIHSGKKEKKDFHSNEKVEWEVPDGISKNEEKEKGLEAEKRRLEEEKKRLEAEKQKQEEQERLEKERKEKEKEKQEEAEKRRLEEEKKRLEAEKQKQEEQERLEKERKEKEKEKQEEA
ncbi:two-partner secretion domain-containing protein, partial [Fusobacterium necrophorum]